ncbi:hypothetical protein, partial [Pseudomonas viridiflava]|uniref:hypothetical protein n=1 Tax=Pseudomonas viridiflava TaxID=33069 RepID=UPI001E2E52C9
VEKALEKGFSVNSKETIWTLARRHVSHMSSGETLLAQVPGRRYSNSPQSQRHTHTALLPERLERHHAIAVNIPRRFPV